MPAAITRLLGILEDYDDYEELDKIVFYLGMARTKLRTPNPEATRELAVEAFERLRGEYPESEYVQKIPKGY